MKVLIADDVGYLDRIREQLEPRGFKVVQAPSADAAFHLWQIYGPWDFVVTDCCFVEGQVLKTGMDLIRVIHAASPPQRRVLFIGDRGVRASPVPVPTNPCSVECLLRLLRLPVLPLTQLPALE